MTFEILAHATGSHARAGILKTTHGSFPTPIFTGAATKGTVKGITPEMLKTMGVEVVLGNTYHLYLQPGDDVVQSAGGLGSFMGWDGPTITDSGGFQVFSLGAAFGQKVSKVARGDGNPDEENTHAKLARIDEEGVTFRSHIDGSEHRFTPERSMEIQWNIGADIIFSFDECTSPRASYEYQKEAMERTHRWAKRGLERHNELDQKKVQALFGVVQGGQFEDLRKESARVLSEMELVQTDGSSDGFDGFGIGGSFTKEDLQTAVKWVTAVLPENKPRHLLGIGEPGDILLGIEAGCDVFDCVLATRLGRTGTLYTKTGLINILNNEYRTNFSQIEETCECYTCTNFSRAYLAHLFHAKEMLGGTLASIHNVSFIVSLVQNARKAIFEDTFDTFKTDFFKTYYTS